MPTSRQKSKYRKKEYSSEQGVSPLEKEWPPAWSVSFADLTTLLMAGFILWYALTAIKIPQELLTIKQIDHIIPEEIELLKEMEDTKMARLGLLFKVKTLTPKQQMAIQELRRVKKLKEEFVKYVKSANLGDLVNIETGIEAVLITPRAPLLFPEGDARLKKGAFGLLDKIVEILDSLPHYRLRIEGHTDPTPIGPFRRYKYPSNWELSYARAVSVARYLIANGIRPEAIEIAGYGEHKPKFPNDTKANRAKNRRVDIFISFAKPEE